MPRGRKASSYNSVSKKNMQLVPYHFRAEFRPGYLNKEDIFSSSYPRFVLKILELPEFNLMVSTWNPMDEYLTNCCVSNSKYIRCNGRAVKDVYNGTIPISQNFKINSAFCGDNVPDDILKFIEEVFEVFISEDKNVISNGWGTDCTNEKRFGISVHKIKEVISKLNGVVMARTQKHHAESIKNVIVNTTYTPDSENSSKKDDEE